MITGVPQNTHEYGWFREGGTGVGGGGGILESYWGPPHTWFASLGPWFIWLFRVVSIGSALYATSCH